MQMGPGYSQQLQGIVVDTFDQNDEPFPRDLCFPDVQCIQHTNTFWCDSGSTVDLHYFLTADDGQQVADGLLFQE